MGVRAEDEEPENQTPDQHNGPDSSSNMVNDDIGSMEFPRKKKMFSSSSFYEEPNAIYPTVEEQVEMCRKIADSLSDDCNKKSRGANMFFKRVKKAEKWVVESTTVYENETQIETSATDPTKMPYVRVSKDPPKLKLILDPRHIVDMKRLKQEGVNIVEHNAISPEIFHDLVKDLNSPTGKGAQLFAKRKKKSEEWVVDEEKVRAMLKDKQDRESGASPEPTLPIKPLTHPRVQMIKTPWSAAMESPIGSCEGAFRDINTGEIAETVIRAAEAKIMTYPSPRYSAIEPLSSQYVQSPEPSLPPLQRLASMPSMVSTPPVVRPEAYKVRAPRGWTGVPSAYSPVPDASAQRTESPMPYNPPTPTPSSLATNLARTYSFANFNKSPKAWTPGALSKPAQIKPVKPPSLLVQ